MEHKIKPLYVIGIFLSLLWLAACSTAAPTITPTLDLNPLRTEVAATVLAQVSKALALTPSATCPPTPTPIPTNTSTLTPEASLPPITSTTSLTSTITTGSINQAQWVSQTIADDTIFAPGETFTMTWRLKNAGTSIWTASFILRFYSGDAFGAPKEILLDQIVLPNEMVDISIPMKAPNTPGFYRSDWVLSDESRSNFKEPVFLKITVAAPSTLTPTSTIPPTP